MALFFQLLAQSARLDLEDLVFFFSAIACNWSWWQTYLAIGTGAVQTEEMHGEMDAGPLESRLDGKLCQSRVICRERSESGR